MIILKKGNHFEHTDSVKKAEGMLKDGFEIVKGASMMPKKKKESKIKKKLFKKDK
tara:strand:+ start:2673 stop:2837 length:165 start_codon:yes stop_codon:yes gene_type:complete